jgi:hydroxymethylpyrimidine pyrophosphatase-like HAD family hydrolase
MEHKKTICVDFDGTITDYSAGFQGVGKFGEPLPEVAKYMQKLQQDGWMIIIFTTRGEVTLLSRYLREHDIPFSYINHNPNNPSNANLGKPMADVYLDDRGITFNGNWEQAYEAVSSFAPWFKQEEKEKEKEKEKEVSGLRINLNGSGNLKQLFSMLAWIEALGNKGHSTDFTVSVDGDGNSRWVFKFENKEIQKLFDTLRKELSSQDDIKRFSI